MKQLLNIIVAFRKHILSVILLGFTVWAGYNVQEERRIIANIEKVLNKKSPLPIFFKHLSGDLYKGISDILVEKDTLVANDQKFSMLKRDGDKLYLAIDYDMYLKNDFIDLVDLLGKFEEKNYIFRVSELGIEKKSEKDQDLDIKIKFRALAYDKLS